MNKLNTLLSENMLRFGTKNLSGAQQKQLIVKSIMETIDQNGLRHEIRRKLNEVSASVPAELTLDESNGGLRSNHLMKQGDYVWNMSVTFKGSDAGLTLSDVTFIPGPSAPKDAVTQVVPLTTAFTFETPLDAGGGGNNAAWTRTTKLFMNGIKLNTKSASWSTVKNALAGAQQGTIDSNFVTMGQLGADISEALYYYCGAKGWYTGPDKPVATMYAIFTNHSGESDPYAG
jgi:hypothetical protein